jgi:hypothetical protein
VAKYLVMGAMPAGKLRTFHAIVGKTTGTNRPVLPLGGAGLNYPRKKKNI